ncbi:PAS domain-containing protein [Thalassospiraceae bacterium LMO-JJ14]|nr:PAS domain-containing protein [Thalassospiraceae bacterium LMO-JJ14]
MSDTFQCLEAGTIHDCRLPTTIALKEYWESKYAIENRTPRYKDVNLMDLYKVARLMFVKDVVDDGEDFVNRFWGTELSSVLGMELTGVLVSEYQPEERSKILLTRYRQMVKDRQPVSRRAIIKHLVEKEFVTYEVLHVPFLDPDGKNVSHIMAVYAFNFPLDE